MQGWECLQALSAVRPVHVSLSAKYVSHSIMFFSPNESINSIFGRGVSAQRSPLGRAASAWCSPAHQTDVRGPTSLTQKRPKATERRNQPLATTRFTPRQGRREYVPSKHREHARHSPQAEGDQAAQITVSRTAWSARGFGFFLDDADVRLLSAAGRGRPEAIRRPCMSNSRAEHVLPWSLVRGFLSRHVLFVALTHLNRTEK
jgi:hypothetical protein